MTSTAQAVKNALRQDGVIREALRRGVVNQRALARWLIDEHGWDASEEAVLSAIRRHADDIEEDVHSDAKQVISRAHVNMRSQIGIVKMSKNQAVQKALPGMFDLVDYTKGEALRIVQSERSVKVIVDESNVPAVRERVAEDHVREILRNLTEINLVLPMESKNTPGLGALIMTTLGLHKINVLELVTGIPEVLFFVSEEEALEAYEAIDNLIDRANDHAESQPSVSAVP